MISAFDDRLLLSTDLDAENWMLPALLQISELVIDGLGFQS